MYHPDPSSQDVKHVVGIDKNVIQVIFDNLRALEAEAGRQQLQEFSLEGNVEADATCIRKCPVSVRNCHFADEVSRWRSAHPKEKSKHKWLVLHIRVGGLVERGARGRCLLSFLPARLVRPGAVPPTESIDDIRHSGLLKCVHADSKVLPIDRSKSVHIHSDGCQAWSSECKRIGLKHKAVKHFKMQFVKKDPKPSKGQSPLVGTQKLDRLWAELKKFLGSSLTAKNTDKDVNPRLLQYVQAFQWRYNAEDLWKLTGDLCREL